MQVTRLEPEPKDLDGLICICNLLCSRPAYSPASHNRDEPLDLHQPYTLPTAIKPSSTRTQATTSHPITPQTSTKLEQLTHGSPVSEIIFPAGTMHVMPITDSAIVTINSNTSDIRIQQQHPHPLRSHNSSTDILAKQLCNIHTTQQQPNPPTTDMRSGARKPRHQHRRSIARTSIDTSEFQVKDIPSPTYPRQPSPRFRNDTYQSPATNFSLPIRDYPIIPVRPPLRPTVSFGAISHHSYDSSSPIMEKTMTYEKRMSMEGRDIKPALSQKIHSCFSCCFGGGNESPPSP